MTSKLDLDLTSLYRLHGQEQPALPGLLAAVPPRRTARGRENDRLLICLSISGNVRLTAEEYAEITRQMADRYYGIGGAVTSALKATAEALNAFLLERNMRLGGRGQTATGLLVMGALRDDQLFMALSGPVHAFWLSPHGSRHFADEQLAGRGLGLSQTARLYYAQAQLQPGDRVLFATQLPPSWVHALASERGGASLEATRRRLMADPGPEMQAALMMAREGAGQVNVLRAAPPAPVAKAASPDLVPPPPVIPASAAQPEAAPTQTTPQASESTPRTPVRPPMQRPPVSSPAAAPVSPRPDVQQPPVTPPPAEAPVRGLPFKPPSLRPQEESSPEPKNLLRPPAPDRFQPFFKQLAAGLRAWRQWRQRFGAGFARLAPRLLPGNGDSDAQQPASPGASTAGLLLGLALPVILLTVGVVVYVQYGQTAQYQSFFASAQEAAVKASDTTEPVAQRRAWEETLFWIDKAEAYQGTPESRNLRRQAQSSMDVLDSIKRVTFQLALSQPFAETTSITRMVANENDVFLLDGARGEVYRVMLTQRGYELDVNFICRPGAYTGGLVGPIIDLVSLPLLNQYRASVAAIDAGGNLLYCLPNGQSPQLITINTPETGWKRIAGIDYDREKDALYVLDAEDNAIWTYYGQQGNFADSSPLFFFDEQIPDMGNVVDMAVSNSDDVYLLNDDGHLTVCTLGPLNVTPTRCVDPATFVDRRPGRQGGITLADAIFAQVVFSPPPNTSIVMLDAKNRAVYRFSTRGLELIDQLRPVIGESATLPAGSVTAMDLSPNQILFVFVDRRLYYATDVR